MRRLIIIGTRGKKLDLYQANKLKKDLLAHKIVSEIKIINKKDDNNSLTNDIEQALLDKRIDVSVYRLKDLPIEKIPGLVIAGLSDRDDPADLLIINKKSTDSSKLLSLKSSSIIGAASMRRKSQISNILPGVDVKSISGDVPERIEKLRKGEYDAIIIGAAVVLNLQLSLDDFHIIRLHPKEFIPSPGQGILAYQCRSEDIELRKILQHVHHKSVADCSNIERKVMYHMNNDSLGIYCEKDGQNNYHAFASFVNAKDGSLKNVRLSHSTSVNFANRIVEQLKN